MGLGWIQAGIAQLVERELPKLEVASSNLVARSTEMVVACFTGCPRGISRLYLECLRHIQK